MLTLMIQLCLQQQTTLDHYLAQTVVALQAQQQVEIILQLV
jgi:hypothetical protein